MPRQLSLVERKVEALGVVGSSPAVPTKNAAAGPETV